MTPNELTAKRVAVYSRAGYFHVRLADLIARDPTSFSDEVRDLNAEMLEFLSQGLDGLTRHIESQ